MNVKDVILLSYLRRIVKQAPSMSLGSQWVTLRMAEKLLEKKVDSATPSETAQINNQLRVAQQMVKHLKKRLRYGAKPGKDELCENADKCRKKNGKINYSKLGKDFLGTSHHTAKKWCDEYGIK